MFKIIFFILLLCESSIISGKTVLLSFDSSAILPLWKDSLEFARENGCKYTFYISAPYFVSESQVKDHPYWAIQEIGTPLLAIRKDAWQTGTDERWEYLNEAIKEGHEIASHLCGHYDGHDWTYEQWMKEFSFFTWVFEQRKYENYDSFKGMLSIRGVRAPYLSINAAYFRAMHDSGYTYDSSLVYSKRHPYTSTEIPIREILVDDMDFMTLNNGTGNPHFTLPFDCNFQLIKNPLPNEETLFFDSLCYD
jgi:peptidoglycan/xylan/chitin deacetylase (PgdA/CDA1 family)